MSCGNCTDCSNKCDVCIDCDTGPKGPQCNTQQTFCKGSRMKGQLYSAYGGALNAPTFSPNDIIIKRMPQAELNRWITYLNAAANYTGDHPSAPGADIPTESGAFVTAAKATEIIGLINKIWSGNPTPANPEKNKTIVSSSFFNSITSTLNNLKLDLAACEFCDAKCDVTCNTCNTCDSCISCNTCQSVSSYSSHYSSHYSSR